MLLAYHHRYFSFKKRVMFAYIKMLLKLLNSFKKRVLFDYIKRLLAYHHRIQYIIGFSTEVDQQFSEESTVCLYKNVTCIPS